VHPEDLHITTQALQQAMTSGSRYQHDYRVLWPDGSTRWVEARGQFFYNAEEQPIRMVGVLIDIEQRKQAELKQAQQFAAEHQARQEAESVNRIKDQFLAVLSHELRSPLNPILGWAELLQRRKAEESTVQRALATIVRNVKLQIQLIDDLLDVSRILRGKMELNLRPIQLATVVTAALETVRARAAEKNLKINTDFPPDISPIMGDLGRLQQVVSNLLSNAIKFTPPEGHITIRIVETDETVQIQIQDTGKGISAEFLPHVFDYFRQADNRTTRQFGGLGLGLAIVQHITEQHGGAVKVDSPGQGLGATFTVEFPVVTHHQPAITSSPSCASLDELAGLQILVVDDEADALDLTQTLLEQYGATVVTASSAADALSSLSESDFHPDLLISDIGMPRTDGYMLIRQIRQQQAQSYLPAIALTAYATDQDKQQAIAAGYQCHLAKPIDPERLVNAVASLIRSQ
jgi:signal transduction histidine kinase/ActR/RegA family two-component response regulator